MDDERMMYKKLRSLRKEESSSLVSSEDITRIYLFLDIIQAWIIPVGDDGMALFLESFEVVNDLTAKEGVSVF